MSTLGSNIELATKLRRRLTLLNVLVVLVFFLLIHRLWTLQVLQGNRYAALSEHNRVRVERIPGVRGMVFDRKGRLLVDSRPSFDVQFLPQDAGQSENTLRQLARLMKRDAAVFERAKGGAKDPSRTIILERDVGWESVVAIETHQTDLPGVSVKVRARRSYLTDSIMAHVLGYLGEINSEQLKVLRKRGYTQGDEVGQFGLEKKWERYLAGENGGQQVEVDAMGRRIRVLNRLRAKPGHNVVLTIDRDLQETAFELLDGREGAVVVLGVNSGAVLALVSTPSFDPNSFARGMTSREWNRIMSNAGRPLHNRVVQGQYPPGSTFKIVVALAALEEGVIEPDQRLFCNGSMLVGNRLFRDWKTGGHGHVDLHKALVESCDVYFYQLGQRLGVNKIAKHARRFGFGDKTGIELDHEKPGLIPDADWKKKKFRQPWFPGETPSVAIGQGFVAVTPLQMANLMVMLGNGGTLYKPWFVRRVVSSDGKLVREYGPEKIASIPLKEEHLEPIRRALFDAVQSERGTGKNGRSELVSIVGKTGTAQVAEMRGKIIKSEDLPYAVRDHAWFVAYAPAQKPEIAVAALVEHGGHGGSAAAPLVRQIIEKYFLLAGREVALPGGAGRMMAPKAHAH